MAKERILVVDDETFVLDIVKRFLDRVGYDVLTAEDADSAIEIIGRKEFDLLLTDINMPGKSGIDVLKAFKKKLPDSAAIVVTGEGTIDIAMKSMASGADGFVVKPFIKKEILGAVNSALEKIRFARENVKYKALIPLFSVGKRLMQHLDTEDLLSSVVDVAHRESGADSVSIMLKEDGDLVIRSSVGLQEGFGRGFKIKKGAGLSGRVADEGHPLLLREDEPTELMNREDVSSALILPLKVEGEVLGVMNLSKLKGNYPLFTRGDQDMMSIMAGQVAVALKNAMLVTDLEELFLGTIKSLSSAIDAKSPWTAGHSERVTSYALLLAKELGLSEQEVRDLDLAGILHDIGKIGTDEEILNKPGRLTDEEFELVRQHPSKGEEMLVHIRKLENVVPAVRHHHEMFDGSGYPDGLIGEKIPFLARILTVADTYDAMSSNRPYRKGLAKEKIIEEFKRCSGTQFDPEIVKAFLRLI